MKPRKHAELIKAWADGATIEVRGAYTDYNWLTIDTDYQPSWSEKNEYRIKPEPKPDVYCIEYFYLDGEGEWSCTNMVEGNLKLTFDGETGELKSSEVLK